VTSSRTTYEPRLVGIPRTVREREKNHEARTSEAHGAVKLMTSPLASQLKLSRKLQTKVETALVQVLASNRWKPFPGFDSASLLFRKYPTGASRSQEKRF
jgi:hypothetical protein